MSITGGVIRPNVYHLADAKHIDGLTDNMLTHMRGGRGCGICADKDPHFEHCRHGGPYCITHDDEYFERCRYQGFDFPLDCAKERDVLRKWVEAELAFAKGL